LTGQLWCNHELSSFFIP